MTVRLTNVSRHDLLIPPPHIDCGDVPHGSLFFRIDIQRTSGPVSGMGCAADYVGSIPVQQRIRTWNRLAPGQSLDFKHDITSEPDALIRGTQRAGRYSFSVSYLPPYLSPQDQSLLQSVRIAFPEAPLETPWISFDR